MPDKTDSKKNSKRIDFKILGRIIKMLFKYYPGLSILTAIFIIFSAIVSSIPPLFLQRVIETIGNFYESRDWEGAKQVILPMVAILITLYAVSVICILLYRQLSAYITHGLLYRIRKQMFDNMQNLPIRYFDRNSFGDIMSYYTNDIDAIRQVVSETLPIVLQASVIVLTVLFIMAYYSVWLMLLVLLGVAAMLFVSKRPKEIMILFLSPVSFVPFLLTRLSSPAYPSFRRYTERYKEYRFQMLL